MVAQKQIKAPFAGKLGIRQVELGQHVSPGETLVTLTDLDQLYVNFTLPEQTQGELALGATVEVRVDALPGRVFEAELTTVEPQVDPGTRTIRLQATLPNPGGGAACPACSPMRASCCRRPPDVVTVPETAVTQTLYGDSVFVVKEETGADGKPVQKAVQTFVKTGEVHATGGSPSPTGVAAGRAGRGVRPAQAAERCAGPDHRRHRAHDPRQAAGAVGDRWSPGHALHRHLRPPAGAGHRRQPADPADRAAGAVRACRSASTRSSRTRSITVTTAYPGASPELMQGFITTPIAQAVAQAEGIDYLTSASTQGTSTVTAYIKLNWDPNAAMTDVMAKVNQVKYQMPRAVQRPGHPEVDRRDHRGHVHRPSPAPS